MITLDTAALLAILNRVDPHHARTTAALREGWGPYIVPVEVLGALAYMIETR
jgi:predicted nucleic acid-binding protein